MTQNAAVVFPRDRLQVLLAETLGWEKSGEVIERAFAELGLAGMAALTQSELGAVLDHLGDAGGLPGVAARFVRRRLEASGGLPPPSVSSQPALRVEEDVSVLSRRSLTIEDNVKMELDDFVELLSPSVDPDTSREALERTARALGFTAAPWSRTEGMAIMDRLSKEPGLIGVVSRLAKARLRLSPVSQGRERARTS